MKLLSYSYNIVDAPEKPPVQKTNDCLVVVECESESAANLLVEALRGSGYLDKDVEIYIKKIFLRITIFSLLFLIIYTPIGTFRNTYI